MGSAPYSFWLRAMPAYAWRTTADQDDGTIGWRGRRPSAVLHAIASSVALSGLELAQRQATYPSGRTRTAPSSSIPYVSVQVLPGSFNSIP